MTIDKAVQTIKEAILRAQAQASQSSNAIQLSLYYGIGRYVSINLKQAHWGAKSLETISNLLQHELPGLRGFSSGNLKKMRIFYEEWQCLSIGSPMANQLQLIENKVEEGEEIGEKTLLCINRPLATADLHIEDENPSIGIVLCKEMNKAFVDIVVRNYDSPMGVATYKTKQDMPENLQKALPDLDKMKDIFSKSL